MWCLSTHCRSGTFRCKQSSIVHSIQQILGQSMDTLHRCLSRGRHESCKHLNSIANVNPVVRKIQCNSQCTPELRSICRAQSSTPIVLNEVSEIWRVVFRSVLYVKNCSHVSDVGLRCLYKNTRFQNGVFALQERKCIAQSVGNLDRNLEPRFLTWECTPV